MELKEGKRSKESIIILIIVITLILYISNTSDAQVIKGLSNFIFSIVASIILVIIWFILTK